jgi:hypothetical protein
MNNKKKFFLEEIKEYEWGVVYFKKNETILIPNVLFMKIIWKYWRHISAISFVPFFIKCDKIIINEGELLFYTKEVNRLFKVISPASINYWKYFNINFTVLDNCYNIRIDRYSILSIHIKYEEFFILIEYDLVDTILLLRLIESLQYALNTYSAKIEYIQIKEDFFWELEDNKTLLDVFKIMIKTNKLKIKVDTFTNSSDWASFIIYPEIEKLDFNEIVKRWDEQ